MKDLSDLSTQLVLRAIKDLVETGNYQDTNYSVWFHGNHISPARVVTRAYELIGSPIDRKKVTTSIAQKRLLELGFPIIKKSENDFFNEIEQRSFEKIVSRKVYNSDNEIDRNIGDFLNQVPWEKTKRWGQLLGDKGWIIKGGKNWNKRHGKNQGIKDYTWFRIYPKNRLNDLICFTVGMHGDGELVYKLHNKFADDEFKGEKGRVFNDWYHDKGLDRWPTISVDEIDKYDWRSLIEESNQYFTKHLSNYNEIVNILFADYERRIMRLTWNENNWEKPSPHKWKPENQGNKNIAYENQYGYGHEEWLFNHRYKKNGYHYGYVRGVDGMKGEVEKIDELVLYSIAPDSQRYLIGEIRDVVIIEGTEEVDNVAVPLIEQHIDEAIAELESVNADVKTYKKGYLPPNIKFKWEAATIFSNPVKANYLKGRKYNRFKPYKLDHTIGKKLGSEIDKVLELVFISGKASTSDSYDKKTSSKKTKVQRSHTHITNDLFDYLNQVKGVSEEHLSAEKTRVGGAIVDLAMKDKSENLTLFEAKTSSSGLSNIRQALGQLFEYAFLDESAKINELVIVGPAELKEHEIGYLNRIRAMLNVPLNYWTYIKENRLEGRFLES